VVIEFQRFHIAGGVCMNLLAILRYEATLAARNSAQHWADRIWSQ
jgi:hypothetical protein